MAQFEQRPSRAGASPQGTVPQWQGEDLEGRSIVVWDEQGFGDQIQMARYVPLLQARGARVEFAAREPLRPLNEPGLPDPVALRREPRRDYWVLSMSLPARFATTVETIPPPLPIASRAGGRGVSVVARGGGRNPNDANRSLPAQAAARLMDIPGAVSLEPEQTGATDFA